MIIDWKLATDVGMPIITLFLGALVNHLLQSRPKVISHLGFISSHKMPPQNDGSPGPVVNTHSVVIRNVGRKSATNVRLGHTFFPNVNVHPDIAYEIKDLPGGGKEMVFPTLIPKKEITISYLYFAPMTWERINTHIESDDGPAKVVNVLLQAQVKPWLLRAIWATIVIGLITIAYSLIWVIRWAAT